MAIDAMTQDAWLNKHPYLQTVAALHALVDATLVEVPFPKIEVPVWANYSADFREGIPLLQSQHAVLDLGGLSRAVAELTEKLSFKPLPGELLGVIRTLNAEVHGFPDAPTRAARWLVNRDTFDSPHCGLLWFVGWIMLARHLSALVATFDSWRDEDQWLRSYCPLCGAPPSMGQLVGVDPGRIRFLSCGCCRCRWRYRRTACPFCEKADDQQIAVLAVEGENGLRIDYCNMCRGYLKTYAGSGSEQLMLADWSSVHLDVLACERGLKRQARSLYELPSDIGRA